MMLSCVPKSVFNWDYRIEGARSGPAELSINFFTEAGGIGLGPEHFDIRKQGWLSGRWTLEAEREPCSEANKPNPLVRRFVLTTPEGDYTLRAQNLFTRAFSIYHGEREVGTIQPSGLLARRASINCLPSIPERTQLFAFWLVVLTWRRSANASNGAP